MIYVVLYQNGDYAKPLHADTIAKAHLLWLQAKDQVVKDALQNVNPDKAHALARVEGVVL